MAKAAPKAKESDLPQTPESTAPKTLFEEPVKLSRKNIGENKHLTAARKLKRIFWAQLALSLLQIALIIGAFFFLVGVSANDLLISGLEFKTLIFVIWIFIIISATPTAKWQVGYVWKIIDHGKFYNPTLRNQWRNIVLHKYRRSSAPYSQGLAFRQANITWLFYFIPFFGEIHLALKAANVAKKRAVSDSAVLPMYWPKSAKALKRYAKNYERYAANFGSDISVDPQIDNWAIVEAHLASTAPFEESSNRR